MSAACSAKCMLKLHHAAYRAEGEALARKNGELEATLRKVRAAAKDAEAARDRAVARAAAAEQAAVEARERAELRAQDAAAHVSHCALSPCPLVPRPRILLLVSVATAASASEAGTEGAELRASRSHPGFYMHDPQLRACLLCPFPSLWQRRRPARRHGGMGAG